MPIRVLEPRVVTQIAAGEVVERPASVVKELVENSLDADSAQITVEVTGSGLSLLQVSDNGTGIPSNEVELAFERHATSKISRMSDLDSIGSLGFRGEALPSIAAVAQVEVLTCAKNDTTGIYLSMIDGAVVERHTRGRSQGTTITVRNLFRKVPARLKFLKSAATENSHMAEVVTRYALSFPEVKFSLVIDGRTVLRTPGSGKLLDSVIEVYGRETAIGMLEIDSQGAWEGGNPASVSISVSGMVGAPSVARASRDGLSFFVNRRWVSSRMLGRAVEDAYHGMLMQGKFPLAIINISIPPGEVDVNIHPTKREVRFRDERSVFGAVQKSVRRALIALTPVPRVEEVAAPYKAPTATGQVSWEMLVAGSERRLSSASAGVQQPVMASLPVLRVLGQLSDCYIVAEGPDGLYLIDQHAAHERILFEKVMEQRSQRKVEVQGLLEPAAIELEPKQAEAMRLCSEKLAEFGFSLEPFGERVYLLRAVPALLHDKDLAGAIHEALESFNAGEAGGWEERLAISIACHSAVRAGQPLSIDEMRELVRRLEKCGIPHTCPHGRPTTIKLSMERLRHDFGRV